MVAVAVAVAGVVVLVVVAVAVAVAAAAVAAAAAAAAARGGATVKGSERRRRIHLQKHLPMIVKYRFLIVPLRFVMRVREYWRV